MQYPLDADKRAPIRMVRLYNLNSYIKNNLYDFSNFVSGSSSEQTGLLSSRSTNDSIEEIEMTDLS